MFSVELVSSSDYFNSDGMFDDPIKTRAIPYVTSGFLHLALSDGTTELMHLGYYSVKHIVITKEEDAQHIILPKEEVNES